MKIIFVKIYVILIGLLQSQYYLSGYHNAEHMNEETKRAHIVKPTEMINIIRCRI
jgi:hypothetical protein